MATHADRGAPVRSRMSAADRRQQLAETAARQFHHIGFHRVTVADVAAEVGVTPPAIYRHFRNKQELLFAAVETGLTRVEEAMSARPLANWPERIGALADVAAERRDLWVLLQREMRHIDPDRRQRLEERFRALVMMLRSELVGERPDLTTRDAGLLVTAILAVMSSQSVYPAHLPATDRRRVLAHVALALSHADAAGLGAVGRVQAVDRAVAPSADEPPPASASRSASLLDTSIKLFHERGFDAVSLDDIGAAAGMAGPSVLHHYPSKGDLLVGAFKRATDKLTASRLSATSGSLADLVQIYVDVGVRERLLLGVYVLEIASLPSAERAQIARELQADIDAWEQALHAERPELTATERTILVHAARAVIHDVARVGSLHDRPSIRQDLTLLLEVVLTCDLTT